MKSESSFREFRPALRFLLVFVVAYVVGNIIYGLYVEFYRPKPDPMTVWVTEQVATILTYLGTPVSAVTSKTEPIVTLDNESKTVLRVFEGCNGLNVLIVFASFMFAFGGPRRKLLIYCAIGTLILHVANLLRIILLYQTAISRPLFFYYFHKYFFTAVLYLVVFALWIQWTRMKPANRVHS